MILTQIITKIGVLDNQCDIMIVYSTVGHQAVGKARRFQRSQAPEQIEVRMLVKRE